MTVGGIYKAVERVRRKVMRALVEAVKRMMVGEVNE